MVSAICKAKDKSKCRYHGSVERMNRLETELVQWTKEHGTLNFELMKEYTDTRTVVESLEKEGWEDTEEVSVRTEIPENIRTMGLKELKTDSDYVKKLMLTNSPGLSENEAELFVSTVLFNDEYGDRRITDEQAKALQAKTGKSAPFWKHQDNMYREELDRAAEEANGAYVSQGARAQSGAKLDKINVIDSWSGDATEGTVYHRRREGVHPDTPYSIRVQANRQISNEEARHLAGLMGYAYRSTVAGESLGDVQRDTAYSFIVSADTTKSSRDDLGMALEDFEQQYPAIVKTGSPVRKTDRSGPGTKGTSLVPAFDDDSIELELYYDDVYSMTS